MNVSRRSLGVNLSRLGIVFVIAVTVGFSYLVWGTFTGPESQLVTNAQYPLKISLPLYPAGLNGSSGGGGLVSGLMQITGETPVDHEVVAYQPVSISVQATFAGSGGHSIVIIFAGVLVGQPSGSAITPLTQTCVTGLNGQCETTPSAAFYPTSGTFSMFATDAVSGVTGTAQVQVQPPYLAQESTINHVELVLAEAVFFFGIVSSILAIKELAPYAFPAKGDDAIT